MATSTGNFGQLLEPGLTSIWGLEQKQWEPEYSRIFEIRTSKKAIENTLSMTGFGVMPTKPEGQSVTYDDPIQGFKQSLTNVAYGLGCIITLEMYEDDLYDKINAMPRLLSRAGNYRVEVTAANVLNRAFNSSYTGADGVQLCSASHKRIDGGTFQNTLTTAADLSMTSLEQALIDIAAYVDDRGILMKAIAKKLIVPPTLLWTAKQLMKSEKDPETANNGINPANGMMPIELNHFLTDTDAWFIQTDVPNGLLFYWRRRPAFTKDNDHDTDNAKFKETMRFVTGWDDPRNVYGSPGA